MRQRAKKARTPSEKPPEKPTESAAEEPKATPEPGVPDPGSVVAEEPFTSPSGAHYRIFHTDETDAYEEPPPKRRRSRKRRPE